jgi:diguanylate cyclase (GGDEF)-like protein/PAS domain S-box-containing protein
VPLLPDRVHRALFEASPDALLVVDEAGTVLLANAACTALLGYTPQELVGAPIERLIPVRHHQHRAHRDRYLVDPRPRQMGMLTELHAVHRDGHEVAVDVALTPERIDGARVVLAAIRDMRRRVAAGATLRVQATALRSAANGIVITDDRGYITWVNPAACRITGHDEDELVGRHTRLLKSGEHDAAFYQQLWETVLGGATWSGVIVNRRKDGTTYTEEQTIAPVVDEDGRVTHFIAIKQDVSERQRAQEALARAHAQLAERMQEIETLNRALQEQATRDPLTGLYNRRYFHETVARDRARTRRDGDPLCLIVIDLDHFKIVNDAHGHEAGDRVLVALAAILTDGIRASDLPCRFGGEEFVVAMPGAPLACAAERVDSWRQRLAATPFHDARGAAFHVSFSAGVIAMEADDETLASALHRADAALYTAKRAGRDRVVAAGRWDGVDEDDVTRPRE